MQSPHFDASAYQSAIYGTNPSFEAGTIKLHHPSYAGEPEAGCYSNYVSPALQTVQGYGCRDPPSYSETSFFHSAGIMPNFGNANYYKMANRQMEVPDYTGSTMMPRPQDNFLMKAPDPLALSSSPNTYENDGSNSNANIQDDQANHHHHHHPQQTQHPHHHHHTQQQQQQPQHHHHQTAFENTSQTLDATKLGQENPAIYGHTAVKLEHTKIEPTHSHGEFEKSLRSSTNSPSTAMPMNIHHENDPTGHLTSSSTSSCSQISGRLSPKVSEAKSNTSATETTQDSLQNRDNTEEKKTEDTSGDSKPTMSYIALIAKAILESEQRRLNLGSIYNWIEKHYPFYKTKGQGWRNSVRHNLSLNDCFIKAGRCEDGKGNYWAIHPANIQDFMRGDFRQRRRSRRRGRKKECDLSMYHVPNGYLQTPAAPLASSMTFNPAALSSIYSPYTEAERRAYRLDEALLRQSMNNPFVKWYQQGVSSPAYGVSTSPPACGTGVYPNSTPVQWPQAYTDTNAQTMYPALNSTFTR